MTPPKETRVNWGKFTALKLMEICIFLFCIYWIYVQGNWLAGKGILTGPGTNGIEYVFSSLFFIVEVGLAFATYYGIVLWIKWNIELSTEEKK